jgi:hypothetical protein
VLAHGRFGHRGGLHWRIEVLLWHTIRRL